MESTLGAPADTAQVINSEHQRARGGFRPEIESLRGVAALTVAVAHCFVIGLNPGNADFSHGFKLGSAINLAIHLVLDESGAVVLFFVISGYVLGLQLDHLTGRIWQRLTEYYVRRIFRIVPAMWTVVLFAFTLKTWSGMAWGGDVRVLIETLTFRSSVLDGPLWTIIIEMACSMIFPLLYLVNRRAGAALNLVTLFVGWWLMDKGYVPEWARYIIFFQLGLFVGSVGTALIDGLNRFAHWAAAFSIATLCITATACAVLGLSVMIWLRADGVAAFVLVAFLVARPKSRLAAALNMRLARFVGRISYSLYLIHYVVIEFVISHLGAALPSVVMRETIIVQAITAIIAVPVSIALATLLYHAIEAPSITLGRTAARRAARRHLRGDRLFSQT